MRHMALIAHLTIQEARATASAAAEKEPTGMARGKVISGAYRLQPDLIIM